MFNVSKNSLMLAGILDTAKGVMSSNVASKIYVNTTIN